MRCWLLAALLLIAQPVWATTVTWDANVDAVDGYRLVYGPVSKAYVSSVDVGKATTFVVDPLITGPQLYVAVVAYHNGLVSGPSNELVVDNPACTPPFGHDAIAVFVTALQTTGSGGALSKARLDFQLASPNSPITHVAVRSNGATVAAMDGTDLTALAGLWFTVPATPGTYPLSVQAGNAFGCIIEQATTKVLTVK